jgi:hypothetical protein
VTKRAVYGNFVIGLREECGGARLGSEATGFYEGVKDFVREDGVFIV